ncbi:hypothetical protein QAD02_006974 [Eretmocerus hayati]|uniref:Uncharacterized protein n=1 Tax=Eretmocerus hayati TaxID=131215 RepID=A0ACC2N2E3_9HYME|nr:hypothetical protein QAD02_006974 [Eretmocerus hayati]
MEKNNNAHSEEGKPDESLMKTVLELVKFFADYDAKGMIPRKSSEKSMIFRDEGNKLYRQNKHTETHYRKVLSFYTKSIAYAPLESEELALALSNRSTLWLHLHRYDLSLIDIDKALQLTKPTTELSGRLQTRKLKCLNLYKSYMAVEDDNQELKPMINRLYSSPKLFRLVNEEKPEVPRFIDDVMPELPKFKSSKSIHCAADSITMLHNKKYGRHYIAARDIKPGEVLMSEESPYVSVEFDQMYLICSHCLAFAWTAIPCDHCVFAVYCSETCKNIAWSQYHDVQCSILPFLNSGVYEEKDLSSVNELVRMTIIILKREGLETVLKKEKHEQQKKDATNLCNPDPMSGGKFKSIDSLMLSSYDTENDEKDITITVTTLLSLLFTSEDILRDHFRYNRGKVDHDTLFSLGIVLKRFYLIQKLNSFKFQVSPCVCNDHTMCRIKPDEVFYRGSILGFYSSLFNHSCDPNVSKIFLPGPKIVFFAVRPIKQGEQLFISYVPAPEWGKESRQKRLQEKYSFSCDCKRCKADWQGLYGLFPQVTINFSVIVMQSGEYF